MDYKNLTVEELEKLAVTRDVQALCELGRRYRFGVSGVEQNYTAAYRMYHKAEKLNDKEAFIALGQMYEKGEYFAKNKQLAQEYYSKASVSTGVMNAEASSQSVAPKQEFVSQTSPTQSVYSTSSTTSTNSAEANNSTSQTMQKSKEMSGEKDKQDIAQNLKQADTMRAQGDITGAKLYVQQAVEQLNDYRGVISTADITELEAHVNWMYAYIAFNEQKYADFERYVFQNGVAEYFPWSTYLTTVVHRMLNANVAVLSQDAQRMINVLNNPRIEPHQLADVLGLLGDLCLMGISTADINPTEQAFGFYQNAADMGNQYAGEQLKKFTKNMFGKLVYKER